MKDDTAILLLLFLRGGLSILYPFLDLLHALKNALSSLSFPSLLLLLHYPFLFLSLFGSSIPFCFSLPIEFCLEFFHFFSQLFHVLGWAYLLGLVGIVVMLY